MDTNGKSIFENVRNYSEWTFYKGWKPLSIIYVLFPHPPKQASNKDPGLVSLDDPVSDICCWNLQSQYTVPPIPARSWESPHTASKDLHGCCYLTVFLFHCPDHLFPVIWRKSISFWMTLCVFRSAMSITCRNIVPAVCILGHRGKKSDKFINVL